MIPEPLYRPLQKEYAEDALKRGILKLGTLGEYKQKEMSDTRRDEMEGSRTFGVKAPLDMTQPSAAADFVRDTSGATFVGGSFKNRNPDGQAYMHEVLAQDGYILCLSKETSPEKQRAWGGPGLRIDDPEGFFAAIEETLSKRDLIKGTREVAEITYDDKIQDYSEYQEYRQRGLPIWRTKPSKLATDKEVRAIWMPKEDHTVPSIIKSDFVKPPELKFIVIECPGIIPFISANPPL